MRVKDLRPQQAIAVTRGDTLRDAARRLVDEDIGALAVFDSTGPVGILSERDLARAVADGADLDETAVHEYMTASPVTIDAEGGIGAAVAKMNDFGVRHLLVREAGEVSGVISMRDVVALLGTRWREQ